MTGTIICFTVTKSLIRIKKREKITMLSTACKKYKRVPVHMQKEGITDIICSSLLFQGMEHSFCAAMAEYAQYRQLARRDMLFFEGEQGHALWILNQGCIQLTKSTEDGREVTIRTVMPGEAFGEVVLFEQQRYPVTAMAATASSVIELPSRDFRAMLQHEAFRDAFIAMLMRRQRYLADRLRYLTMYDGEERLARFLATQHGPAHQIDVALSKKNMAAAMGVSPETLSRLLHRLQEKKLLYWNGHTITVAPAFWEKHECES